MHVHAGAADHEVEVDLAAVDPPVVGLVDRRLVRIADRDVARCVLVDERVVEQGLERADAALAVDKRDFAEPARILVARGESADRLRATIGVDVDGSPVLESRAQAVDLGVVGE